ncbi:hypothetical protein HL658_19190 [Azospirillum sp. RWY-5-1]|uniref:Uncharacterized protein n=1 Tax=Azospirillum oleiclasticum TaxID=2735135 RepID=A0ABX2TDD9_9PROT|nr:hypothetical protein [Azospirillum oleiclasticum]NYZ14679.1 hypothetical protein [Azospirillum oleiclasticum]NYZ22335.1 hypothetical protein [Azospirillum oleiclasticum]
MAACHAGRATLLVAAGILMLAAGPAAAQGCADRVERFAATQNLTPTIPPTGRAPQESTGSSAPAIEGSGSGAATAERLNQSGGVMLPPATGDQAVIEPPRIGAGAMPTAPNVAPDPGAGAPPPAAGGMTQAARRAQVDSLVTAARQAALSGDEGRCEDSLSQAMELARGGSGHGQGG